MKSAIFGALLCAAGCGGGDVPVAASGGADSSTGGTAATMGDASDTGTGSTPTGSGEGTADGSTTATLDDSTGDTGTTGANDTTGDDVSSGSTDSGSTDSGSTDSGSTDSTDSGTTDSGSTDSGSTDSGSTDSGSTGSGSTDSGTTGSGSDSGSDSGSTDSGSGSSSTGPGMVCGDDMVDGTEDCDGADLDGATCITVGFDAGTLACAGNCSFDTSGCITFMCGNDTIEGTEICDGSDVSGEDCGSQGFDGGVLDCAMDCSGYDTSGCFDFGGDCCASNGTPGCDDAACTASVCVTDPTCCSGNWDAGCAATALSDAACIGAGGTCPVCGDDTIEGAEFCDGTDLSGQACTDLGYDGGTLGCAPDCLSYDESICQFLGFGDCVNNPPAVTCLAQEQCITDLMFPPTVGVCTDTACGTVADCPLPPPGGTAAVACIDVTGEGIAECIIDCSLGQTCPTGMICSLGLACSWPAN